MARPRRRSVAVRRLLDRPGAAGTVASVALTVSEHPAVADALGRLRASTTGTAEFRTQLGRLSAVLVAEATASLPLRDGTVTGPFGRAPAARAEPPVLVPILRAGAGMLDGALSVWPDAPVGFLGLARDESTLAPSVYLERLGDLGGRHVLVLEPMLATGGSLAAALGVIAAAGPAATVTVAGVVCAPEGVAALGAAWPHVALHYGALDAGLDEHGFIRPGLGDAGDRAWGR